MRGGGLGGGAAMNAGAAGGAGSMPGQMSPHVLAAMLASRGMRVPDGLVNNIDDRSHCLLIEP